MATFHARRLVDDGADGERKDADYSTVRCQQSKHVITPALNPDRRERIAARAAARPGDDRVTEVVADDWLDPVGQVRQQHGVRRLARRRRAVVRIDGLEDYPVAVHVQPALLAVEMP